MLVNNLIQSDIFTVMNNIPDKSVNFVFCDLPFGISKKSGYINNSPDRKDYISKYGKHTIDFGYWDTKEIDLTKFSLESFRILKDGGVCLFFYDIWSADRIKKIFSKFKQPRILTWTKTNPVPINSKLNFLSNAREYMFSFVKGSKPVYNAVYHNGDFLLPICHGKERLRHKTQKPLVLYKELIDIYTNKGDIVFDGTCGTGTTAIACIDTKRKYICVERDIEYYKMAKARIKKHKITYNK